MAMENKTQKAHHCRIVIGRTQTQCRAEDKKLGMLVAQREAMSTMAKRQPCAHKWHPMMSKLGELNGSNLAGILKKL